MTWENLAGGRGQRHLSGHLPVRHAGLFFRHGGAGEAGGNHMSEEVQMIPIEQIRIVNPRYRDQKEI